MSIKKLIERRTSRQGLPSRIEAERVVERNSNIADLSKLKFYVVKKLFREISGMSIVGGDLADYFTKSRKNNLGRLLLKFISGVFADKNSQYEFVKQFQYQLAFAAQKGLTITELRDAAENVDVFFSNTEEMIDLYLEVILNEPKLRQQWLSLVDQKVRASSEKNIQSIERSRRKIKKEIVVIGGGPLTSLLVQLLGPFFEITVITDQDTIGEPWRSRPLFINSTVKEEAGGFRLPLLTNGTTPITLSDQLGGVRLTNLLSPSDLTIECDDGVSRQYIAGQKLGAAVATNIALGVSDFIVDHEVIFENTKLNPNGTKELTLRGKDGKTRKIDAATVIVLTGPGKEVCKVENKKSQRAYEVAAQRVVDQIEKNRRYVQRGRLNEIKWDLPRILTLTSIEKLYGFWYKELQSNPNPKYFPLLDIFQADQKTGKRKSVAIIGGADTAYTTSELFDCMGPAQSYPYEFDSTGAPNIIHYNIPEQTPEQFAQAVRPRYKRVFSKKNQNRVTTNPRKVFSWKVISGGTDNTKISVTDIDEFGEKNSTVFDYIIPATGLEKSPFEELLKNSGLQLQVVLDSEGQPTVKGDSAKNFFICGSASGLKLSDYPDQIQTIIRQLRIPENTISLWVNGLLVERFAWSFLLQNKINATKVAKTRASK